MMIENKVLVTIAIPFYNSEKYLASAIQSVINQTYKNWELLLIDDGGKDNSMSIARKFASRDARIRIISDGENKGLACRLNESISMAKGYIYARMDDDDIMAIDRIETQVSYLLAHPNVDVVGSSSMIIDDKSIVLSSANMKGVYDGFMHPTVCARTEWFRKNPYNVEFRRCQDKELWLRSVNTSQFYNIERPLLFYREIGIPTFKKYRLAQYTLLGMFANYKHYSKPFSWFITNSVNAYSKIFVYALFALVGKLDYLISHRKRKPLPKTLWLTKKDLEKAINPNQCCLNREQELSNETHR